MESHHPQLVLPGPLHETFLQEPFVGGLSSHCWPDLAGWPHPCCSSGSCLCGHLDQLLGWWWPGWPPLLLLTLLPPASSSLIPPVKGVPPSGATSPTLPLGSTMLKPCLIGKAAIRGCGRLSGRHMWFFFILWVTDIPYIRLQMAEKWNHTSHILERENREFQEAMTAQAGTTFSHTNNSSRMEFFKLFTGAGIIAQCTAEKGAKILDCVCSSALLISVKTNSLLYSLSI